MDATIKLEIRKSYISSVEVPKPPKRPVSTLDMRKDVDPLPEKLFALLCNPRLPLFPQRDAKFYELSKNEKWETFEPRKEICRTMLFDPGDGYRVMLVPAKYSLPPWETPNPSLAGIMLGSTESIEKKLGGSDELIAAQVGKNDATLKIRTSTLGYLHSIEIGDAPVAPLAAMEWEPTTQHASVGERAAFAAPTMGRHSPNAHLFRRHDSPGSHGHGKSR